MKTQEKEVIHHASNRKNCSKCMDLWIERENKLAKIERDCMNCENTFTTSNEENADFCKNCR
jgi:hypothetical protein